MTKTRGTITSPLAARIVEDGEPGQRLGAFIRYDTADPYAVALVFHPAETPVRWTVGRDLLRAGLDGPAGEGDIQVWPVTHRLRRHVFVSLHNPDGQVLLALPRPPLGAFLRQSDRLVPPGTEGRHIDLDTEFALLTGDGPPC